MELIGAALEMDTEALTSMLFLITTMIGSIYAAVANTRKKLKDNAVQLIGHAEEEFADREQAGAAKHAYAVEKLQQLVPRPLRLLFSEKRLEQMVDSTFDAVNHYAKARTAAQETVPLSETADDRDFFQEDSGLEKRGHGGPAAGAYSGGVLRPPPLRGGLESTVRVFTVRGRNGILFRIRCGVSRRRSRSGDGGAADWEAPIEIERW